MNAHFALTLLRIRSPMLIFLTDIKKEELDQELLVKLEQASNAAQIDFMITSGFRPGVDGIDHGLVNGPHMTHKAADIRCRDSVTRFKIFYGLMQAGFKRIGIGQIHCHADVCTLEEDNKPENVCWLEFTDNQP